MPTRGALGPGFGPPGVAGAAGAAGAAAAGAGAALASGASATGAAVRGAGRGALGAGRLAAGASVAAAGVATGASTEACGASAAGAFGAVGAGFGPGRGPPGLAEVVDAADVDGADAVALGLVALPLAGAFGAAKDSRTRRATGASTVEDADFTNSPCSLSFASSSLLVTPSSFANSCTRALPATALLTERSSVASPLMGARTTSGYLRRTFIAGASRCAHECSCLFFSRSVTRAYYCAWPPAGTASITRTSAELSRIPDTLNALPNARRRSASARQLESGCNQAPRPGSLRLGSGTNSKLAACVLPSVSNLRATTLSRSTACTRSRHPIHVRTGDRDGCDTETSGSC